MAEIKYSPQAQEDLTNIWNYIVSELFSPSAADSVVERVLNRVRMLEQFPESGAAVEAMSGIKTDLRYVVSAGRVIVYRYDESADTLYILRVHGKGENWVGALFGDN